MTITINAPAEVEAAITEKATRAGLSVPDYFLRAALLAGFPSDNRATNTPTKEEVLARARSGYYVRSPEVSSHRLIEDRREEIRMEAEQEARRRVWLLSGSDEQEEARPSAAYLIPAPSSPF